MWLVGLTWIIGIICILTKAALRWAIFQLENAT